MITNLKDEKIEQINLSSEPLSYDSISLLKNKLSDSWSVVENRSMYRLDAGYRLESYSDASILASAIAMLGEENGCYPDVSFGSNYVFVTLYSKIIKGLHKNDFIMAAKIDHIVEHAGDEDEDSENKNNDSSGDEDLDTKK